LYLRHSKITKNGKTHTYWRLVRSVRVGGKVVQETVAHLGELDAKGRASASALAEHFLGPRVHQRDLFEEERAPAKPVEVHLDQVRVERSRSFGDVWLAWKLWQTLELDRFCTDVLPQGREKVPWAEIAAILTLARFCEPSSELHIAEDWYRRTALQDILGVEPEAVHHTRLYAGLDRLLPHKAALEAHLKKRCGELFDLDFDLLLYDVTSTYFEGEAKGNPLAQRGYSRDKRPDCKQVCIGLVVTRDGFPLGYEVFAGNRTDVTTVEEIVETMEARYGAAQRVWVMDRGMVSEDNLAWLREGERKYLVGTPRSELKKWERELVEKEGWNEVRDGLEVKICEAPDGPEVFVLCRSADRKKKELAMHERFSARIVAGVESLARRLERARKPADRVQAERQIGRLLERATAAPPGSSRSTSTKTTRAPRACGLSGSNNHNGVPGPSSPRAPTSCAPTCRTGARRNSGRPTSSCTTPKLRSGSRRATSGYDRSGTNDRSGCRRTSWCASWPTRCGRHLRVGKNAPGSGRAPAPSWRNWPASRPSTWYCRWPTDVR